VADWANQQLWADKKSRPSMGLKMAASKKVTKKNVFSPKVRRRRMLTQQGMAFPSALESRGPVGDVFEQCGRTLQMAPVSTFDCCLLSSSCKKIMPPWGIFCSWQLLRFPGSTGTRASTSSGSSDGCAQGEMASGVPAACRGARSPGGLVVCVDGGDGVAPPPAVQHVCVLRHFGAILEVFRNNVVNHVSGRRRRDAAMKYVPGAESVGSRAFICCIISDGFMSPISGNLCSSNALAQQSLVYLDISRPFSCSYASAAFSSIFTRLSLMLLQTSVARAESK
jgi:hypothetical protein